MSLHEAGHTISPGGSGREALEDPARPHPKKHRFLRWSASFLLILGAGLVTLLLGKDSLLKCLAERGIRQRTGLAVEVGRLEAGLAAGSVRIQDIKLFNPPEFGGAAMVDIPELYLELDLVQAAGRKLHYRVVRLHLREINVVRNPAGELNVELLQQAKSKRQKTTRDGAGGEFVFAGIDRFYLTLNRLDYKDLKRPANSRQILPGIQDELATDLATQAELERWLKALLVRVLVQEYLKDSRGMKNRGVDLLLEQLKK